MLSVRTFHTCQNNSHISHSWNDSLILASLNQIECMFVKCFRFVDVEVTTLVYVQHCCSFDATLKVLSLLLPSPGARPLGNARRVAKSLRADVGSQVPVIETMELMVYVDKQTADFYGGKVATEAYVTNMLNTVSGSVHVVENHDYVHMCYRTPMGTCVGLLVNG